ncbi:MAG: hypothetical protein GQ564_05895 [Bacteroidales bacterium]|nr:hypothetical protein [Bacteroidales bacterium]
MPKENYTHIIEKQIVEITTDKYEIAQDLQNDVSSLFRQKIIPALEKICDKYNSTKDIIRIDRMELDIGKLPLLEFDKLFCENTVEQFESKLEDMIAEINHSDKISPKQKGIDQIVSEKEANKNQYLSETDKQFEILVQFLKTGNLPWHQLNKSNFDISELFMSLYEKQPEKLSLVLRTLFKSKIVLKRFIYQFPQKIKQSTTELFLSPSQGSKIAELASIFVAYQHSNEDLIQSKKDLQYTIWEVILSRAIQQVVSLEKIIIPLVYKFLHLLNEANPSPESFFKDILNFQVYLKKSPVNKQNIILTETQKIIDQIIALIFHKITSEKNSNTRTSLLKSLKTTGGIKHLKKLKFKKELDKKALTEILKQIESYEFVYGNKESKELITKNIKDSEILISDTTSKSQISIEEKDDNNEELTESTEYKITEPSNNKKKDGISQNTKDQKNENEEKKKLTKKEELTLKKEQKIDKHNIEETNKKKAKSTLADELQKEQNYIHKKHKAAIKHEESEMQDKSNLKKEEEEELRMSEDKDANKENLTESTEYKIKESSQDKKKKGNSQNTKNQEIENEEEKELTKKEDLTLKKLQKIDSHDSDKSNIKETKNNLPDKPQQEQNRDQSENEKSSTLKENVSGKLNTDNLTEENSDSQEMYKQLKTESPIARANQEEEIIKQYLITKLEDEIIIENAGLVLLWPYLPSLFKELDLLDDKKQFKDEQSKYLAIAITQYLVTGSETVQEYDLTFNKLLCGIDLLEPIPIIEKLPENIKQSSQELLEMVVKKWTALKGTSAQSLQISFLQREGILIKAANGWKVQIERITLDILLDKLPWSISIIALPWRKELIYVEW